jgi:serine/threonine protein kinase/tetratricopeptide (TPR) repeat protein
MSAGKPRTGTIIGGVEQARPQISAEPEYGIPPDLPAELAEHARYLILRQLGQGGMGIVYQAKHRVMERQVAIKVISKSVLDKPEALARFQSEVKAAAKLQHPNIVTAYDAEQAGALHMLVMEYVEGSDLARVLEKKGPLPIVHSCNYIRQAALGLQHAFEQGMIHRDIKPQNLMLTPKGQVKILDFGLARVASEHKRGPGLTQDGAFMGTPEYMAPEQATDARTADIRSDIYSLGCTLYALLAGRLPFNEDTIVKLVLAHLEKEPRPLSEVRPDVPVGLSQVVARMLAKNPAERFQTPAEVARALSPFCKAGSAESVPTTVKSDFVGGRGTEIPGDTSAEIPIIKRPSSPPTTAKVRKEGGAVAKSAEPSASTPSRRNLWILAGAGAFVSVLLLSLVGLWASGVFKARPEAPGPKPEPAPAVAKVEDRKSMSVAPEPSPTPPPPPPPKEVPLRLEKIPDIFLAADQTLTVPVSVERGSCKGPILLTLENLPEGASARTANIPDRLSTGSFELFLAKSSSNDPTTVRLVAKGKGWTADQPVRLTLGNGKTALERLKGYTEETQLRPKDVAAWLNLGHTHEQLGERGRALDDYSRAIALAPADPFALYHRGLANLDRKDYESAASDFNKAAVLLPNDPSLHYSRGLCEYHKKRLDRAFIYFNNAVTFNPQFALAYLAKGNVHADQLKLDLAVADYDRAIQIDPELGAAFARRGEAYHQLKDDKKAIADLDRALSLDSKDARAFNTRGGIHLEKQLYDQAQADFDQAIAIDPKLAQAYDNRAVVLSYKKEYGQALKDLDRALELDNRSALAHYHRGLINHEKSRPNDAMTDFTRAISLNPDFAEAYRARADARDTLGGRSGKASKADREKAKQIEASKKK